MVEGSKDLPEGALANDGSDLIPVAHLIVCVYLQITILVVEVVVYAAKLGPSFAQVVHNRVVTQLVLLERTKLMPKLKQEHVVGYWKGIVVSRGFWTSLLAVILAPKFKVPYCFEVIGTPHWLRLRGLYVLQ